MKLALDSLLLGIMMVMAVTGLLLSFLAFLNSRSKRLIILLSVFSLFLIKGFLFAISNWSEILMFTNPPYSILVIDILLIGILIISGFLE